jgi:hypothetical protein
MSYNPISNSEISAGSPMDNALLSKIKNNFEAQQTDLAAKQAIIDSHAADLVTKQATIDGHGNTLASHTGTLSSHTTSISQNSARVIKQVPVGTIRSSMLSLAQFQAEVDGTWMLANGSSCVGTNYATVTGNTVVPDMRGMVPRGKNNGRSDGKQNPDGDVALGTQQDDQLATHSHQLTFHQDSGGGGAPNNNVHGSASINPIVKTTTSSGGNETRMKNVTVNWFIKVGY